MCGRSGNAFPQIGGLVQGAKIEQKKNNKFVIKNTSRGSFGKNNFVDRIASDEVFGYTDGIDTALVFDSAFDAGVAIDRRTKGLDEFSVDQIKDEFLLIPVERVEVKHPCLPQASTFETRAL